MFLSKWDHVSAWVQGLIYGFVFLMILISVRKMLVSWDDTMDAYIKEHKCEEQVHLGEPKTYACANGTILVR